MKAFISPVYIQTNSLSSEKIVLGLIAIGNDKIFFNTSKAKMKLIDQLVDKSIKGLLENSIQMIHNKVNESVLTNVFTEEYFTYLSKYSNGVIQFGSLKPIAKDITESFYKELFKMFVGEDVEKEKSSKKTFHAFVKEKLSVPGVIEKADINYTVNPENVNGLLKSAVVSLLTTNGNIQALQAIDFEATENTIAHHLYEFEILIKTLDKLSIKYLKSQGTYKIIVKEPILNTPQHDLFDKALKFKKDIFQIVEENQIIEETSKIAHSKKHHKFSTFLELNKF